MHTNGHGHDFHVDPSAGYETRDVALHTLVKWVGGLYAFIVIVILGTIPLYLLIVPKDQATQRTGQNERKPTIGQPTEPIIQSHPIQDMRAFEIGQRKALESYGRVKDEPGKVHIPIDKAIDRTLSKGLPSQPQVEAPPPPTGIYTPGDTTSPWPASRWMVGAPRGPKVLQPGVITNGVTPPKNGIAPGHGTPPRRPVPQEEHR